MPEHIGSRIGRRPAPGLKKRTGAVATTPERGNPALKPSRCGKVVARGLLLEIERLYLQNQTISAIAKKLNLSRMTVGRFVEKELQPKFRKYAGSIEIEMHKVDLLERIAWERFNESQSPQTRETIEKEAVAAGARLKTVRNVYQKVTRTGEATWLNIVQWCIDYRAKIRGDYAAQKHSHQHLVTSNLRVAGHSVEEFGEAFLMKLMQKIAERRQEERRPLPPPERPEPIVVIEANGQRVTKLRD